MADLPPTAFKGTLFRRGQLRFWIYNPLHLPLCYLDFKLRAGFEPTLLVALPLSYPYNGRGGRTLDTQVKNDIQLSSMLCLKWNNTMELYGNSHQVLGLLSSSRLPRIRIGGKIFSPDAGRDNYFFSKSSFVGTIGFEPIQP
ncbi:hypothetical protein BH10BAC4_BH10BAC4_05360 [soil metagenome]